MDDTTLLRRFEQATLPAAAWNHRAHLRVAWCLLERSGYFVGLARMRAGIRALNRAHQTPETATRGYHETITKAWFRILHDLRRRTQPELDSERFCRRHEHALERGRLLRHFSPARLASPEARCTFLEPDRVPIPLPSFAASKKTA